MRYSNTTLKELTARYRAVLKKCVIFNVCLFLSFAVSGAAQAIPITVASGETQEVANVEAYGQTGSGSVISNAGTLTVSGTNEINSNTTEAGAVIENTGVLTLVGNNNYLDNSAQHGGVIRNKSGKLTLGSSVGDTSVFVGNTATGEAEDYWGGAIYNYQNAN